MFHYILLDKFSGNYGYEPAKQGPHYTFGIADEKSLTSLFPGCSEGEPY